MYSFFAQLLSVLFMAASFSAAYASDENTSENKVKLDDVKEQNRVPDNSVDEMITNKKMRAESGSKSKYSIRSVLKYEGGSIEKPLDEERPNIGDAPGMTDFSVLTGEISGKYTIDSKRSLMAGVGVRYITPLAGFQKPAGFTGDKVDADNPYLYYQYVTKVSGIQTVLTAQPRLITQSNLVKKNYVSDLTLAATTLYDVGTTGLSIGVFSQIYGVAYSKDSADDNDLSFGIDPFIEYQINDTFNLRTVFNVWNYDHFRAVSFGKWERENLLQSVGVGISVNRDIYLYPNLQFILDDIRADRTNIGLQTALNLF